MGLGTDIEYGPFARPASFNPGQGPGLAGFLPGQGPGVAASTAPAPAPTVAAPYTGPTGPMGGRGYDPSMGSYDGFKASRRAYRSRFRPGGDVYERQQDQNAQILAERPRSRAELVALLNRMGIYDRHEEGQARFRSILMDYDNDGINGNYHYGDGVKYDVATSDVDPNSPTSRGRAQAMTPADYAHIARGFYGRLEDSVGVPQFQRWQRQGRTGFARDPATGYLMNVKPDGTREYVDDQGFEVDPQTGRRIGHYSRRKRF
jgi:hypothetical protein